METQKKEDQPYIAIRPRKYCIKIYVVENKTKRERGEGEERGGGIVKSRAREKTEV